MAKITCLIHCIILFSFCLSSLSQSQPSIVNKKVSVSEVSFDSHVEDIQWCGDDHRTVLLKTRKGRLYRSKDGGRQWMEITDILKSGQEDPKKRTTNGNNDTNKELSVQIDNIIVSPVDKKYVLVVGTKRSHFVSEDGGNTFRKLKYKMTVHNWHFHPSKPTYALVSTWTDACYDKSASLDTSNSSATPCNHQLRYTRDLGRTFHLVAEYVVQFSWGDKKLGNESSIFYTQHRGKDGHQPRYGGWSRGVDFYVSHDFGVTSERLVYRGNKFLLSNGYLFVAKLKNPQKQSVQLLVSIDGGKSFNLAKLPVDLEDKSYTVLDTSEGAIMLHVNHGGDNSRDVGNVYISDGNGIRYSLSLPNNIRTASGECEFDKLLSLEGVYIANFKDTIDSQDTQQAYETLKEQEEEAEGIDTDVRKKHSNPTKRSRTEDVVRTVISFDKGGVWSFLKAPKVDSRGQQIDCPANRCWLHLNGITKFSEYAPFYSVENAVGLIMGTGNVGSYLRNEKDEVNTYLSRDGGLTWIEAHKGAFIYEMGDHGGLLVMGDDTKKTNQVVFSWNEGVSWYDFELGSSPLYVDNIVTEPKSSSVEFLLYGKREGDTAGVLFHLDFNALNQQKCKGIWAADSVSSDYETWSPSDGSGSGEKCLLGRHVTYTRRKQTSECFNGRDFERPKVVKTCTCTMEDYECEFGFGRSVGGMECTPIDPTLIAEAARHSDDAEVRAQANACTSSSFFKATAYRKVPGDACEGGIIPEKVLVPCPVHSPVSRAGKTVLFFLFIITAFMVLINYLNKYGALKKFFKHTGFESFSNVSYSLVRGPGGGDFNKSREDRSKYEPELGFIDSEQDENEEDAPTLMNYRSAATSAKNNLDDDEKSRSSRVQVRNSSPTAEFELESDLQSHSSIHSSSPKNNNLDDNQDFEPIPRLAPPRFDDDSVELL